MNFSFRKQYWLLIFACILAFTGCSREPSEDSVITFVGDTSFGESYEKYWDDNFLESEGYEYSLQNFEDILTNSELVLANLETPLTPEDGTPLNEEKDYIHFSHPEKSPKTFLDFNMTVFSLANNHAMDYGEIGLQNTFRSLEKYGLTGFGAGENDEEASRPFLYTLQNGKLDIAVIAGFAYFESYESKYHFYATENSPGVNRLSTEEIKERIASLRAENPDVFIILFPHWGKNYVPPTNNQRLDAHKFIDLGADLVIGHGGHVMQEVEEYNGKWIVYGLGNFMFNSPGRYQKLDVDPYSLIAQLRVSNGKKFLRLYPIVTDNLVTKYQDRFVNADEFAAIKNKYFQKNFTSGTDEFGYFVEVKL